MGSQHVPLFINDDGLVSSVGEQKSNEIYETCIICGAKTNVLISTHIDYRYGYVEGAGQCCKECYDKPNAPIESDYIKKTMKNRTTLITISAEDILNTPNDFELGQKVRNAYWSIYGDKDAPEQSDWVCEFCGHDTSNVDYDYLVGSNHLSCALENQGIRE